MIWSPERSEATVYATHLNLVCRIPESVVDILSDQHQCLRGLICSGTDSRCRERILSHPCRRVYVDLAQLGHAASRSASTSCCYARLGTAPHSQPRLRNVRVQGTQPNSMAVSCKQNMPKAENIPFGVSACSFPSQTFWYLYLTDYLQQNVVPQKSERARRRLQGNVVRQGQREEERRQAIVGSDRKYVVHARVKLLYS